ncbi:leucine-rich repeat-containing protein 75B-like [Scleropages formosus]|uniref:Leucine rich repeat containing 75Bb n=1 Tax=Scleropages formosus TaxID=113540 RepID=A0A8C9TER4_SCLFO|nr:leucine-rich repeat-containing protein 75B-like [Scleropages formosus]
MGSRLSRQESLKKEEAKVKRKRERRGGSSGGSREAGPSLLSALIPPPGSRKLPGMLRRQSPSPYVRRVAWIRQIQRLLGERDVEQAADVLKVLRKDMGLEGSSLSDILYKNAAFLNLVDPISHELLLNLARDMQCPKKDADPMKSSDRICRQLIYHLTPHSKWVRQGTPQRKSQACLKVILQKKVSNDSVDLSGIPLSTRDIHRVAYHLQNNGNLVVSVDLSFTTLRDESLCLLLPFLGSLPKLTMLALNGNRLTVAAVKELTEAAKDPKCFPSLAWVDVGNNVDIFTMPQPLLVALRRRCGLKNSLPTIYEYSETQSCNMETCDEEDEEELGEGNLKDDTEQGAWKMGEKITQNATLHCCKR